MLQLRLLGSPEITSNGQIIHDLSSAKSQALLYYLAMTGRPQSRLALAGLLWPEKSDAQARMNLRQAIHQLHVALPGHIVTTRSTVGLDPSAPLEVDVLLFEALAESGLTGVADRLQAAADRYSGEFLSGFYVAAAPFEEWMIVERERLCSLAFQILHQISTYYVQRREIRPGLLYTRRLLTIEPWHEETHRQMMRLLAWNGQIGAALAQYQRYRQTLADELGAQSSAETVALYEQIRAGDSSAAQGFAL
jgi:DNA-binding SARP family transcriptional activator